jgi:hypothetical protein
VPVRSNSRNPLLGYSFSEMRSRARRIRQRITRVDVGARGFLRHVSHARPVLHSWAYSRAPLKIIFKTLFSGDHKNYWEYFFYPSPNSSSNCEPKTDLNWIRSAWAKKMFHFPLYCRWDWRMSMCSRYGIAATPRWPGLDYYSSGFLQTSKLWRVYARHSFLAVMMKVWRT